MALHFNTKLFFFLPAKYYSSAIVEIGLALFATCVILNFYHRKSPMPGWLQKVMFRALGPMVFIKYNPKKSQDTTRSRSTISRKYSNEDIPLSRLNGHTKKNSVISEPSQASDSCNTAHDSPSQCTCRGIHNRIGETDPLIDRETLLFNHPVTESENSEAGEMAKNSKDWQMAAHILDRVILVLAIFVSVVTFVALFVQAPRVRELISIS